MTQLLSTLALFALLGWFFVVARRRAMTSRRVRQRMILVAVVTLVVVPAIGYLLTKQVPDTPGSPAALVGITLIWLIGGVFILFALPSLLGALVAKPATEDEE